MDSEGGISHYSRTMFRLLRAIEKLYPLYIINTGLCGSAGATVYMAAKKRLAFPDAHFMLHRGMISKEDLPDDVREEDFDDFKALQERDESMDERLIGHYGLTGKLLKAYKMGRDIDVDVKQAKKFGIVTHILEVK